MKELWRDINGYNGDYQISNMGRIISFKRGKKMLNPTINNSGYEIVVLSNNGKQKQYSIHRLVAEAFLSPTNTQRESSQINHKDSFKLNNYVDNLEFVSCMENVHHAMKAGKRKNLFQSGIEQDSLYIYLPKQLKKELKIYAATNDTSMSDVIIDAVQIHLKS